MRRYFGGYVCSGLDARGFEGFRKGRRQRNPIPRLENLKKPKSRAGKTREQRQSKFDVSDRHERIIIIRAAPHPKAPQATSQCQQWTGMLRDANSIDLFVVLAWRQVMLSGRELFGARVRIVSSVFQRNWPFRTQQHLDPKTAAVVPKSVSY
jgi:hypothetical protein